MTISFQKAVKYEAKGRVALIGPAGSGKSYTMLTLAQLLAGPTGKIAAVDTEHGSLSKYADLFDFDVVELDSFSPDNFLQSLRAAEQAGYAVFCCDSLSHFWMGKDGALEFVDNARKRYKDDMGGWKEFRPHERQMVDAMIASSCHVICTMRTKTAYDEQVNPSTGKKQRVKIGLAPVQRDGLEFEFDFVGSMDEDNALLVDKTRCSSYAGRALTKPSEKDFALFRDWLSGASAPERPAHQSAAPKAIPAPAPISRPPAEAQASRTLSNATANRLDGSSLHCNVKEAIDKKTKSSVKSPNGNPYIVVGFEGRVGNYNGAFCWHASLFDTLRNSVGEHCQFEVEEKDNRLSIENIIAIGNQEYRDGKPYTENVEADPIPQPNSQGLFITDEDIPF